MMLLWFISVLLGKGTFAFLVGYWGGGWVRGFDFRE